MNSAAPRYFLSSYKPLVWTTFGRAAALKHGLLPFIDGSIRREPDLEHEHPSISCLCRAGKFAPRLRVGDVVGYITAVPWISRTGFSGAMMPAAPDDPLCGPHMASRGLDVLDDLFPAPGL